MFQSFEPRSDRSYASAHTPLVRAEMERLDLDGFLIPHDDEYGNEYTPYYAERLLWATGFSGSAGSAIVLKDKAAIFIDGRYTLQVKDQVDDAVYAYVDYPETTPAKWLRQNAPRGGTIGYDPMLHNEKDVDALAEACAKAGARLVPVTENPVDAAWKDQPAKPEAALIPHPRRYAGRGADEKIAEIAEAVREAGADAVMISSPLSVAWLFNVRGGDVAHAPVPLSRAMVGADGKATLFIDPKKVSNEAATALADETGGALTIRPETDATPQVAALGAAGATVLLDPALAPAAYAAAVRENGGTVVHGADPCALPRALKTGAEIEGARAAHVRDGAAVTRFLHWLATEAQDGSKDEIAAARQLQAFRQEIAELKDISFETISAAGPNGAFPHYRVSTETNRPLAPGSLYLVDSGGQYPDGTTDITRVAAIGDPTDEMAERYTLVLKGHIALATARFPKGTTGQQLDGFARRPLWDLGMDYDHGTGHGVGSFLSVHEGPQRIAKTVNAQALEPGMICSNEPGYYKGGEYGIRIENLVVVTAPEPVPGGDREMMGFETITLAPLERRLIVAEMLTADERRWVDAYHARVREVISPLVPADVARWLDEATGEL
ncbi:MAG: aminopeptidase P family protein [Pseudomonadota bacterium]